MKPIKKHTKKVNTTNTCPLCGSPLAKMFGNQMFPHNPEHGVTLWCPSHSCPAQEVMGHGDSERDAYSTILEKYRPSDSDLVLTPKETSGTSRT